MLKKCFFLIQEKSIKKIAYIHLAFVNTHFPLHTLMHLVNPILYCATVLIDFKCRVINYSLGSVKQGN